VSPDSLNGIYFFVACAPSKFLSQTISARTYFFPHTRNTRSSTPLIPAHPPRFETFYASKVSLHHKEMLQRSTAQRSAAQRSAAQCRIFTELFLQTRICIMKISD